MNKGKIIGIIICAILALAILTLLICNWTGAFAEEENTQYLRNVSVNDCYTSGLNWYQPNTGAFTCLHGLIRYDLVNYEHNPEFNTAIKISLRYNNQTSQEGYFFLNGDESAMTNVPYISRVGEYVGSPQSGIKQTVSLYGWKIIPTRIDNTLKNLIAAGDRNSHSFYIASYKVAFQPGQSNNLPCFYIGMNLGEKLNQTAMYYIEYRIELQFQHGDNNIFETNAFSQARISLGNSNYLTNNLEREPIIYTQQSEIYNAYNIGYNTGAQVNIGNTTPIESAKILFTSVWDAMNIKIFGVIGIMDLLGIAAVVGIVFFILNIIRG